MSNPFDSSDALQQAQKLARAGDLIGAAELCRALVARKPVNFHALFMLGTIESHFGHFEEAEKQLQRAVEVNPRSPEALTSYGNALLERKKHALAIEALNKALSFQPQNPHALLYRGLALAEAGKHREALKDFDSVLRVDSQSVFALHNRANALIALNRPKEARPSVEALLKLAPSYIPALANYAIVLMSEKKHQEALAVLDKVLATDTKNPELMNARGNALLALKCYEAALASYDKAALLKPDSASFQISRGNLFAELGRHDEALCAYEKSIALNPDGPEGYLNRANMLMEQNHLEEALAACEKSITVKADYAPALVLKGNLLLHQGRAEDAAAAYDRAVTERPEYAEAAYHRGSALLLRGHFRRGWRDFERRWEVADCGFDRPVLQAREWRGEKLAARSIVVYSEQGMGDAIQFARLLPRLAASGAKLTFLCHPGLVRVFRPFAADMEVTAFCDAERRFDFQCALMSLAERFGVTLDDLPGDVPYLFAEGALVAQWRRRIAGNGFRIGICWQGNPIGKIDKGRSIPLAKFQPLAALPGVRLISLQKRHGLDQLAHLPAGMNVETLGAFDQGDDAFIDTAAIMQNLDLVITSDTASAHIAGALGRPVWVAVKHMPDWRWMLERSDSPWYPSMRLFRQPVRDDWDSVFCAMADALVPLALSRSAP